MTNFKKSFGVLAFGLLALTFCCALIAQSTMAKSDDSRRFQATPYYEDGTVPLPGPDVFLDVSKAAKRVAPVEQPTMLIDGVTEEDVASRMPRALPSSLAVAQGGEDIASATVITPGSLPASLIGSTVGYADDYADPCGFDGTSPDVVYSYSPLVTEYVNFDMCASSYDTKLWVVEASTMDVLACNDDGPDCTNYQSQIEIVECVPGETYYIIIGGYYFPEDAGDYQLDLALYTFGDDCLAAEAITAVIDPLDPLTHTASWAVNAGTDVTTCGGWSAVGFLNTWQYIFTATETGLYTFTFTDDGANAINSIVGIEGGYQCGAGAPCLDYGFGSGSFSCQTVMLAGWTYRMAVGSGHPALEACPRTQLLTGTLSMTWQDLQAFNDECADAEDLGTGDVYAFVHNVNSTLSPDFDYSFCDPVLNPYSETCGDVWYTWTADTDGYVAFDMCLNGDSWDSKLFVYRGYSCSGSEVIDELGCSDDGCGFYGDGGYVELECTVGETFMFRIAGWKNSDGPADAECAAQGGMGTGHIDIVQHAAPTIPVNNLCRNATVGVLAAGGDVYTATGNRALGQWGNCPSMYGTVDGSMGLGGPRAWMVWEAFSISECTDIRIDFCGTSELGPSFVTYTDWPQGVNLYTGCPCEGPFVAIPATSGTYTGVCDPVTYTDPDANFSRGWDFPGLLPSTYYWLLSNWQMGRPGSGGSYTTPADYTINFHGTPVACEYCAANANINSCPPVAGASWIQSVAFGGINKGPIGDEFPVGSGMYPDDCQSYEDHTDQIASLYKGVDYDLSVVMGKVGIAGEHDSCDVWIDWNQNSGFASFVAEINERIDLDRLALTWTATVTVPMDAAEPGEGATGVTAMRVRMASDADGPNTPCGVKVWGEVEDFTVEVASLADECGDFDIDGTIDADDIAFLRDWYFGVGTAPDFWQRADIDGDGMITIADVIGLVDAAYNGGATVCL